MAGISVLDELFKSMQIEKKTIKVKPNWLDHLREKNGIPTGSNPDLGKFLLSEANNTPQLPHFPENTQNLSLRRRPRKQAHPKRRVLGLSHPSTSSTSTTAEGIKPQQQQQETVVVVVAAADDDVDAADFVAPADPVAFAAAAAPVPLAAPAVPAPLAAHVDLVAPAAGDHRQEGDPQVPVVENPLRPRFRVHVIRPALRQVEEEEEEEEEDLDKDEKEEEESDITELEGINHAHLGFQDQSEVESEPSVNG